MITEDYVSFETAKLLKEKGFEGQCSVEQVCTEINHNEDSEWTTESEITVGIPTLHVAMKWLRENHNLYVTSVPNGIGENVFYMSIYRKYDYGWTHISDCFDEEYKEAEFSSPEEACDNGLQYCLENLI